MPEPTDDIIVCSRCIRLAQPPLEDWPSYACIEELIDNSTLYRCPKCDQVVYRHYDLGYIEMPYLPEQPSDE